MPIIRFATTRSAAIGFLSSATIAGALAASASPVGAALIMHKDLPYSVAKTIAEVVIHRLRRQELSGIRGRGRSRWRDVGRHARR